MFERRLKIFLLGVFLVTGILFVRSATVQISQADEWIASGGGEGAGNFEYVETTRGRILDCKGLEAAIDRPCTDACVDYRAVVASADGKWLLKIAKPRLKQRLGEEYTKASSRKRQQLEKAEIEALRKNIEKMWQ